MGLQIHPQTPGANTRYCPRAAEHEQDAQGLPMPAATTGSPDMTQNVVQDWLQVQNHLPQRCGSAQGARSQAVGCSCTVCAGPASWAAGEMDGDHIQPWRLQLPRREPELLIYF